MLVFSFLFFAIRISRSDIRNHQIKNLDSGLFLLATLRFGGSVKSGAVLFLVFLLLYLLPSGLGFGDVKLSFAIGAQMGAKTSDTLIGFFLSLTIIAGLHYVMRSLYERKLIERIPLAPSIFLAAGIQMAARISGLLSH